VGNLLFWFLVCYAAIQLVLLFFVFFFVFLFVVIKPENPGLTSPPALGLK